MTSEPSCAAITAVRARWKSRGDHALRCGAEFPVNFRATVVLSIVFAANEKPFLGCKNGV